METPEGPETPTESTDVDESDPGPPLRYRVVEDVDPDRAAADLVESMGAELAHGHDAASEAVGRRLAAAHTIDTAHEIEIGPDRVERIRKLAADLERAERIRVRTEVQFTETLSRKLSRGTGLAVHPEALYGAASVVLDARTAHERADLALIKLGSEPDPSAPGQVAPEPREPHPDVYDDEALERSRDRTFAVGVIIGAFGLAVLLAVLVGPVFAIAPPLIVIPVVAIYLRRSQSARTDASDRREASSTLAAASLTAEQATATATATRDAVDRWGERSSSLRATRDAAAERLRAARRAWESLAGPDADVDDVESVVRARDPQFQLTGTSAAASPTMRAVNTFHRRALARWKVLWASLGRDEPPAPADIEEVLAELALLDVARATLAMPLVIVDPFMGIAQDDREALERDLAALADGVEVVVVEPPADPLASFETSSS